MKVADLLAFLIAVPVLVVFWVAALSFVIQTKKELHSPAITSCSVIEVKE